MVGVLRSTYDRKTGKCLSREIVEVLDMTDKEYYAPLIEIEAECMLEKLAERRREAQV